MAATGLSSTPLKHHSSRNHIRIRNQNHSQRPKIQSLMHWTNLSEISSFKVFSGPLDTSWRWIFLRQGSSEAAATTHRSNLLVVLNSRTLNTAYPWNPETEISVCGRLKTRFWCLEIKLGYFEGKMTPGQFGNVRSCYCRTPAPLSRHLHGPNSRSSTESNLTWLVNIHTVASLVLSSFNQDHKSNRAPQ